jgi:hypothetical protein
MSHPKEPATEPSDDIEHWRTMVDTKTTVESRSAERHTPSRFVEGQLFDLQMLGDGDRIQVLEDYTSRYSGVVDTNAPSLGIIWIRIDGLGERKLILCTDYRLRKDSAQQWDLRVFSYGE